MNIFGIRVRRGLGQAGVIFLCGALLSACDLIIDPETAWVYGRKNAADGTLLQTRYRFGDFDVIAEQQVKMPNGIWIACRDDNCYDVYVENRAEFQFRESNNSDD